MLTFAIWLVFGCALAWLTVEVVAWCLERYFSDLD